MGIAIYYLIRKESGSAITKNYSKRRLLNAHEVQTTGLASWQTVDKDVWRMAFPP